MLTERFPICKFYA